MPDNQLPPHSVEAEQALLGGLILDSASWHRIGILSAADFYRPDHRLIFAAIRKLCVAGRAFDLVLLGDHLEKHGKAHDVGGLAYLGTLARNTAGSSNVGAYADKVREYSLLRRLQSFGDQVARNAAEGDGPAALMRAQQALVELQTHARTGNGLVSSTTLTTEFVDDLDSRRDRPRGLETGISDFDELTHGLEPGDLVVIAARPGVGKTALLVTIASHVAQDNPVAVFSAEMPSRQLMRRCVALLGNVSQTRLRRADKLSDADWVAISTAATQIAERRLWIDDTAAPTLAHIRSECLALKARDGLALVVVDYLQLVRGEGKNRYEEMRDVSYGSKALAKDLAVPVIALAQLNRGVESRESKRPHASDLRDSGSIEEAADIIGLLYSESQYDADFAMPDVLECNVVKHRNGERSRLLWSFNAACSRITVLDNGDSAEYRRLIASQKTIRKRTDNDL